MKDDLWRGELVQLKAADAQTLAESFSRWSQNSEFSRLLNTDPSRRYSVKASKEWAENNLLPPKSDQYHFAIHTLEGDRLIGDTSLDGILWTQGEAWMGIGIGAPEAWGRGYGTDAVRVLLRFAFSELNLHRVTLDVFEYNPRAIRSYEKAGFVFEGRARQYLNREGRRWDLLYMGILREEWEKNNKSFSTNLPVGEIG